LDSLGSASPSAFLFLPAPRVPKSCTATFVLSLTGAPKTFVVDVVVVVDLLAVLHVGHVSDASDLVASVDFAEVVDAVGGFILMM